MVRRYRYSNTFMQYRYVAPSSHFIRNGVSLDFCVASLLKIQFACTSPSGSSPRWGAKNVLPLNLIALPRGEGCDTRIPSSKKVGEATTRTLNPEPNESKVKRGCEEMRIHFFTAPLCLKDPAGLSLFLQSLSQLQALISLPWLLSLPGRCLAAP